MRIKDIVSPYPESNGLLRNNYKLALLLPDLYENGDVDTLSEDGIYCDSWAYEQYYDWYLPFMFQDDNYTATNNFQELLTKHLTVHWSEYEGLVELAKLEYNPIENYNKIEYQASERNPDLTYEDDNTTTTAPRNDTTSHQYGQDTITDTFNVGGNKVTDVKTTYGKQHEESEERENVRPFGFSGKGSDEEGYARHYRNPSSTDVNEHIDDVKTTEPEYSDRRVTSAKTDTDTYTTKLYEDKLKSIRKEYGNESNVMFNSIKGNIGVTTSQQMIQAERNILKFSIFQYIMKQFFAENGYLKTYDDMFNCPVFDEYDLRYNPFYCYRGIL